MSLFGPSQEMKNRREQHEIRNYLDNDIRNAYAAFECEDYQAALFYFNKVLSYGKVPAIQNDKAVTLMMLRKFPEAIECLGEISTDAPKEIMEKVYINMGKAYFYLDDLDMASFWLRKHRYINPHSSSARELEQMIQKRKDGSLLESLNEQYHERRKDPEMKALMDLRREETEQRIRRNLEKSNSNIVSSYSGLKECPNCYNKVDTGSYIYKVKNNAPIVDMTFQRHSKKKHLQKNYMPKMRKKI